MTYNSTLTHQALDLPQFQAHDDSGNIWKKNLPVLCMLCVHSMYATSLRILLTGIMPFSRTNGKQAKSSTASIEQISCWLMWMLISRRKWYDPASAHPVGFHKIKSVHWNVSFAREKRNTSVSNVHYQLASTNGPVHLSLHVAEEARQVCLNPDSDGRPVQSSASRSERSVWFSHLLFSLSQQTRKWHITSTGACFLHTLPPHKTFSSSALLVLEARYTGRLV